MKQKIRAALTLAVTALILLSLFLLFRSLGVFTLSQEDFREVIASFGAWAPLSFILATVLQVTLIPIPSTVTILGGSYLFGALPSFLYSYLGLLLGSMLAFFLGRWLGLRFVYFLVGDRARVDDLLHRLRDRGLILLFFMFLFPAFPDDLLCLLAGLLPISPSAFLLTQLLTRATSVGATLFFFSGEVIPFSGWGIPVMIAAAAAALILFVLSFVYATPLLRLLSRFAGGRRRQKGRDRDA